MSIERSRRLAVASVALLAALAAPELASAASTTFRPVADAYVSQSYPSSSYGTSTRLRALKQPLQRSYVRFNVAGLIDPVSKATLRLWAAGSSTVGLSVRSAPGTWSETTITYANAPAPTIGASDPLSARLTYGYWLSVDVTQFVAGNGAVNLALTTESTTALSVGSREAGTTYAPQLVVETTPPPPAPRKFSFVPVGDAYVDADIPTVNYGATGDLRALGSPERRAYVRFSITGLGLAPTRATLRLRATQALDGLTVRRVTTTTWDETTITYENAPLPAIGAADPVASPTAAGGWVDVDVTQFVTGNGPVSFALTTSSAAESAVASRETFADAPRLLVETPSVAPDGSLAWPISATFYYPWFPEAWNQQGYRCGAAPTPGLPPTPSGCFTWYYPSAGFYSLDGTAGTAKIDADIRALTYGGQEVAIASWWGPNSASDLRVSRLLSRTRALGSKLKWALYDELEGYGNLTVTQIRSHLYYIKTTKRYSVDTAYLRVGGKPVLFVYSADDLTCEVGQRWKTANETYGFHLVFKVFPGYRDCGLGVDWHQYGPAVPEDHQKGFSFSISPGFWLAGEQAPRLQRDPARWTQNIGNMRSANVHWRLVTTYNEWGEGTSVESAREWASPTGFGLYLDALKP